VSQAAVFVVAVKPQDSELLLQDLASLAANETRLFISIMAGVSVATIESALGGSNSVSVPVVRAMPNLPAQCGAGMSVYFAGEHVSEESRERAQSIFETFGRTLQVREERMLDAATAISGTGPAYLYFLLEQLKSVALEIGFSEGEAALLLEQTVDGALALWRETGKSPSELVSTVASKGGTTEAALAVLNERGAALAVQDAVRAAHARSVELGRRTKSNGSFTQKG
jgi:pyrroline-5-carboxylate reductase